MATGQATGATEAAKPRYILGDDQRKLIAQDKDLNMVLVVVGDMAAQAKADGKQLTFADINAKFGDVLPTAQTHFKRGKKAGQPRSAKAIKAENDNKAAALFRRVKQRYGQSTLLPLITRLDSALGGSQTRTPTVELSADQVEASEL
jgi:hypothetical protein